MFLNRFLRRGWYILWVISCTSHFISCGEQQSTGYKMCSTGYQSQDISYVSQRISEKRVVCPVGDILYITFLCPVKNNSPQDIKCAPQDITHRTYTTLLNRFLRRGWYILWVISCTSHFYILWRTTVHRI